MLILLLPSSTFSLNSSAQSAQLSEVMFFLVLNGPPDRMPDFFNFELLSQINQT